MRFDFIVNLFADDIVLAGEKPDVSARPPKLRDRQLARPDVDELYFS
jgi:hypothetical protein